jgi:cyclase
VSALTIPVISSGGAGTPSHFLEVFTLAEADAALAAGVFHFGDITIPELKQYLHERGVAVRL